MSNSKSENRWDGNEMKLFCIGTVIFLYVVAFLCESPIGIAQGMLKIVKSRDALITDYFVLAGWGAAFFNAATITTICLALVLGSKIPFTGPTMAALFINIGYGFWGKNPLNIIPILLGVYLHAKLHHIHFGRLIYTALFGTCLAPFVTEFMYMLPFSVWGNMLLTIGLGTFIGFILPPLSSHTASMHMGYNLFNVGFSAGIFAFVVVCIFRAFGLESETVLIWQYGKPVWLIALMYGYFIVTFLLGYFLSGRNLHKLWKVFRHPGRAVADFVLMDGAGASMMNMSIVGCIGLTYILLIKGDLSGPITGSIFIAFGFASMGAHVRNYPPILMGVYLFSLISNYSPITPGMQLAALFAVGLSPIAGQFGVIAGILAGMLHGAIVMCTANIYGGLNLYNNGFSAGWVAIFMVPTIESFMKHFENRKKKLKERLRMRSEK